MPVQPALTRVRRSPRRKMAYGMVEVCPKIQRDLSHFPGTDSLVTSLLSQFHRTRNARTCSIETVKFYLPQEPFRAAGASLRLTSSGHGATEATRRLQDAFLHHPSTAYGGYQ